MKRHEFSADPQPPTPEYREALDALALIVVATLAEHGTLRDIPAERGHQLERAAVRLGAAVVDAAPTDVYSHRVDAYFRAVREGRDELKRLRDGGAA